MAKVQFTAEADQELAGITAYIAKDKLSASLRWVEEIRKVCELLASQPELGQRIKTKRFGESRRHVFGNYLIYYRSHEDGVQILLIAHGARYQERLI